LKFVTAVVAAKQAQANLLDERLEHRSQLIKNILLAPFTGGITLLRLFFPKPR
jgi:hypothetical protein